MLKSTSQVNLGGFFKCQFGALFALGFVDTFYLLQYNRTLEILHL